MAKHVVAKLGEIAPNSSKVVRVKGREIALFNVNGEYFALLNRCPHEGAPLSYGRLYTLVESDRPGCYRTSRKGEMLRCPWHGWEFDVRTGQSYCDPARIRVKAYEAKVESGAALAEGPYVAESFPASVEEDYIVVEM